MTVNIRKRSATLKKGIGLVCEASGKQKKVNKIIWSGPYSKKFELLLFEKIENKKTVKSVIFLKNVKK